MGVEWRHQTRAQLDDDFLPGRAFRRDVRQVEVGERRVAMLGVAALAPNVLRPLGMAACAVGSNERLGSGERGMLVWGVPRDGRVSRQQQRSRKTAAECQPHPAGRCQGRSHSRTPSTPDTAQMTRALQRCAPLLSCGGGIPTMRSA